MGYGVQGVKGPWVIIFTYFSCLQNEQFFEKVDYINFVVNSYTWAHKRVQLNTLFRKKGSRFTTRNRTVSGNDVVNYR